MIVTELQHDCNGSRTYLQLRIELTTSTVWRKYLISKNNIDKTNIVLLAIARETSNVTSRVEDIWPQAGSVLFEGLKGKTENYDALRIYLEGTAESPEN